MIVIKDLSTMDYATVLNSMQEFTAKRTEATPDEIWFCEHPAVFTLGRHADPNHILNAHDIPVIHTDRGGQVTFHGPGQLMVYCLFDLKRRKIGVAQLVCQLERLIIKTLQDFKIKAECHKGMPGVYVNGAKICSIGLRVQHGRTYHGLALNVNMDLTPFSFINPCGYKALAMTQIADFVPGVSLTEAKEKLSQHLRAQL